MDWIGQTALSPNVKRLIAEVGVHNESSSSAFLSPAKIICWERLKQALPDPCAAGEDNDTKEYFEKCVYALGYLFQECEKCIEEMTFKELVHHYSGLIQWTGHMQVIHECFRLVKTNKLTDNYIALLLITSCIERSLGDVHLLENTICPSMLKDILSSSTLKQIFGPTVVQVLRAVIGPPITLNLRNVVWHGFPSELEISKRYSYFLLMVIPSLNQFINRPIPHREPVSFPQDNQYENILPDLTDIISLDEMNIVLGSSDFIPSYHLTLWKSAMELYFTGHHGLSVVMMLPLFEHGLRCLFTVVNKCPERTVTAEATTLYTTLDEILDQHLNNNVENIIPQEIGVSVMDLILDLFTYPSGPRVRDKLSHGEADIFKFPRSISTAVFILVVYLTAKYNSKLLGTEPWFNRINSWVDQYETMFHPVSLVKTKIHSVIKLTGEFSKRIQYNFTLDKRSSWDNNELLDSNFKENDLVSKEIQILINLMCNKWNITRSVEEIYNGMFLPFADGSPLVFTMLHVKIQTLFRYQKDTDSSNSESELVSLLLRIGTECETIVIQVFTALKSRQEQLENKSLRSRQRNNLQSLIKSCYIIHQSIHLILLLTCCYLVTIETNVYQERSHIKCLKMVLQYTENLRTFTNAENNKWTECVSLSIKIMEKLKQFLT